jgi:hypothetical protein
MIAMAEWPSGACLVVIDGVAWAGRCTADQISAWCRARNADLRAARDSWPDSSCRAETCDSGARAVHPTANAPERVSGTPAIARGR